MLRITRIIELAARVSLYVVLVIIVPPALWSPALPGQSREAAGPSIDALLERVNAFWGLLAEGKKPLALEYVHPSHRDGFLKRREPSFSTPRVTQLEFSENPSEVFLTVTVKRVLFPTVGPMDWPVREAWEFKDGNWFVITLPPSLPFGGETPSWQPLSEQEKEDRKALLRKSLSFETSKLEFGTVRRGDIAGLSIKYRLEGEEPIEVGFRNMSPDLSIKGSGPLLKRGKDQRIEVQFYTGNSDGEVKEKFSIIARYKGVEVPFEFSFNGYVYTPVSVFPSVLRFASGEKEKTVAVRNNSKREVEITSLLSQSSSFEGYPLPKKLSPGEGSRLTVRLASRIDEKNFRDLLGLLFKDPVEGMSNISLPVIVNYSGDQQKSAADPSVKEIEEWLRKKRP